MNIRFEHGLGDAANFAHMLPLWINRGHHIAIECSPDKACLFKAAGAEVCVGAADIHHYWHAPTPGTPNMSDQWSGNKVAWNLSQPPLPAIGTYQELWPELLSVNLTLPTPDTAPELDAFLDGIGKFILLHTRGNTGPEGKNCSGDLELDIYRELLRQTDATVLLLDWDDRVSRLPHRRVRHLADEFRLVDVKELAYMMKRASLFIGVDSGPLQLTRFTTCPALGLWFAHHPAHYSLPRSNTAHIVGDHHGEWNRKRRHEWNILDCPKITGAEVARHAARALHGTIGRELVLSHCLDKLRTVTTQGLHDRDITFGLVFDHLRRHDRPRMIETGCARVRDFDDWTAGFSTYVFGMLLQELGGRLDSIDIDEANVEIAREWVKPFGNTVNVHHSDSREWLRAYRGEPYDVAYLDSADLGTDGFERINLEECQLVVPHLKPDSLILIDDTYWQRGKWHGKGALTIPFLCSQGWRIVYSGWATLLARVVGALTTRNLAP